MSEKGISQSENLALKEWNTASSNLLSLGDRLMGPAGVPAPQAEVEIGVIQAQIAMSQAAATLALVNELRQFRLAFENSQNGN